jgi:hypothetical protein
VHEQDARRAGPARELVRAEEHGVVAVHGARPHVDLHVRPAAYTYTSVTSAPRTTQ